MAILLAGDDPAGAEGHWAFQPVGRPEVPEVRDPSWAAGEIDRFILVKLEEKGLTPSPPADRRTLIRRASLDLTGLPPTYEEVQAFEADPAEDAYPRLLDRLLASPRYGERWARHWLDVARYADTKGYVFEEERRFPYAYTYRDYVIRAFNADLPYDRFILEQLAADQLPLGEDKGPLAAMGFLTLGRRFLNNQADIIDDRIDVVTRGMMGLTVTCARCHDHKYDPIPTRDYYSLYGVFASSVEPREAPVVGPAPSGEAYQAFEKELRKLEDEAAAFLKKKEAEVFSSLRSKAGDYLLAIATRAREAKPVPGELPLGQVAAGDLNPQALRRWNAYLEETSKEFHPVFAPWHALRGLPEQEFAARAPAVIETLRAGADARGLNPLVAAALSEKTPATMRDLAERYGELLAGAEKLWQESLSAGAAPAVLPDPAREELRQVLHGPGGPLSVGPEEVERFFNREVRSQVRDLRKKADRLKATSPAAPPRAMMLVDAASLHHPRVFIRGNPQNPGEEVPRQFLSALARAGRKPFEKGSGRLELAQAIASPDNPLTARVMVNRIWLHHFGAGLVRTPSDFGLRCDPPAHRELLDWLARRFMADGWSVKRMHRLIMLSSAYRQSSAIRPEAAGMDPENRLLSRAERRRLEFEALRDSLLLVAGELDSAAFGPAVEIASTFSRRRTVYGFIDRQNLPGMFGAFDFATPDASSPQRFTTTVPQQALFMLNSPFVIECARRLASRPEATAMKDPFSVVGRLHRLVHARDPDADELSLGAAFLMGTDEEPVAGPARLTRRERLAQALLLSNEFAFTD